MNLSLEMRRHFDSLNLNQGHYLLAFSGGPDSVYLLWMLSFYYGESLKEHITLCYINYHDSAFVDKEEGIVDDYISLFHLNAIKNNISFPGEGNFEDWARNYRYSLFEDIILKEGLDGLLVAHQKTDVVETYLLQKQRKNYPTYYGLRQISPYSHIRIIRPILDISKKELTDILDKENKPYYFDITNTNPKKQRNRIRMELKEEELDSYLKEIQKENEALQAMDVEFKAHENGMYFDDYDSQNEEYQRRYIFFLLDEYKIKNRESMGKQLFYFLKKHTSMEMKLDENHSLYRYKGFFFIHESYSNISYSYTYEKEGIYENEHFRIDLTNPRKFNFSAFPITIRSCHKGDRIATDLPTKDVQKSLQKQSVPFYYHSCYPVIQKNGDIICLPFYKDILSKKVPLTLKFMKEPVIIH